MLLLHDTFPGEVVADFKLCNACKISLDSNKIADLSRSNGFKYPPKPSGLPPLNPVGAQLISPRLPFMQICRLHYKGNYGIMGQIINVPVNMNTIVQQLPRHLDDDHAFNVNINLHI
jgi:hypothetical protein